MIDNKNKSGFTLMELVIVIAILGVVLSIASSYFSFGTKIFSKGGNRADVQASARLASIQISEELRTAKTAELLTTKPSLPISSGDKFNYIYIDGNKIMYRDSNNVIRELFHSDDVYDLSLIFSKEGRTGVNFTIDMKVKENQYQIDSGVEALNIISTDQIKPDIATGTYVAIRYSNPIADAKEIVRLDSLLLDLYDVNKFLGDPNNMVLKEPTSAPNQITLPTKGLNGSTITWSNSPGNIDSTGKVYRPGFLDNDVIVNLTPTVKFGVESATLTPFKVKVEKLKELNFDINEPIYPSAMYVNFNQPFSHQILVTGGNPGYKFTTSSQLPVGVTLTEDGLLSGTIPYTSSELNIQEEYDIIVTVKDSHIEIGGVLAPNEKTETYKLVVN
ncbi:prepilin-type N-terminal cleavage/methylation domain-containing protein [Acetoanaerobium noterae]|uniref:Prepilin-type N-terminal cleavage/methylation domain-containing protein n=1 Tax=Acetoanaerobium noterae TaxID=745369 RepID=A0A1T5ASD1_9FIRM|nr:immunoglobulin-like domain-containing protein [Acetoanaerobium noterae]SKB37769.1 prepilin-type N-terminal cleavage/methylation domain-containing protein [Acetoanaerobium noterae]